jgi:HK97 family phage major capsid protein
MNKLKELQKRLQALLTEGDAIHAKESLTDAEIQRTEAIESEMTTIEEEIESVKESLNDQERRRQDFQTRRARLTTPPEKPLENGDTDLTEDRTKYNGWPTEEAGEFFRAFMAWHEKRKLPSNMHPELRDTFMEAMSAVELRAPSGQNTIVMDEGALLVPETIQQQLLMKIHQEGQVLSRCFKVTISEGRSTTWNGVREDARTSGQRYGGILISRKGESIQAEISKAKFEQVKLELKKNTAAVSFTEEQLEDAPQVNTIIDSLIPKAFVFATEREIIEGAGAAEIEGILSSPALVSVPAEDNQSADTVILENIQEMWNRMPAANRANAVWFINLDVEPQLERMYLSIGTSGVPVYLPQTGISNSGFATLKGRPVIPIEHCSAAGDVGDIILADMGQFVYASKGSMRSAMSMHVLFLQGESILRLIVRDDGKTMWRKTMGPAKGSTQRSPFIAIAAR